MISGSQFQFGALYALKNTVQHNKDFQQISIRKNVECIFFSAFKVQHKNEL